MRKKTRGTYGHAAACSKCGKRCNYFESVCATCAKLKRGKRKMKRSSVSWQTASVEAIPKLQDADKSVWNKRFGVIEK